MNHHLRVRQGKPFALRAACQKERAHAGSHADTDGGNIRLDILHGIINRKTCGYNAAGAVDIQVDIFLRVLRRKEQQLRHNKACRCIVDLLAKENNPVFQQAGINIIAALSPAGLFHDIRY